MSDDWLTGAKSVFSDYATSVIEVGEVARQRALGTALGIQYGVGYAGAKAREAAAIAQREARETVIGYKYGFGVLAGKAAEVPEIVQREAKETALGLKYGFGVAGAKVDQMADVVKREAKETVIGFRYGLGEVGKAVGGVGGGVKDYFGSIKWQLLLPVALIGFVVVLVAIGYSGVGGPAARVAEQEYVKRR